jgi:NADPH-dependent ferric siderophore reductase
MARTNMNATRVKPAEAQLQTMHVVRRERLSSSFARVTLGGGDIERFEPMGFDQWFRLFLPVSETSLSRLPNKLDTLAYLRFLTIAKTERPVLRNYTVRAFRPDGDSGGPELDIDFVLHGSASAGTSGPAASWAETCEPGDTVALLDEGVAYNPPANLAQSVVLVADETALPAAAGILESLPRDARGTALIEVPHDDDRQPIDAPAGVDVRWVIRDDPHATPGAAVLRAATGLAVPSDPFYGWTAGEQTLPAAIRRHWVRAGVPKDAISFCGYWRAEAARH